MQGHAAMFITHLSGSYSGVMGLPLFETAELLQRAGFEAMDANASPVMTAEILVNATARESRAAVVENGVLQEVFIERVSRRGLTGTSTRAACSRVLPGMQAAFIEIGLDTHRFSARF